MPLASLRQSSANNRSNDVRLSVLRNMLRAVIVMLIALCGHNAWSQAPRAIKIVVPTRRHRRHCRPLVGRPDRSRARAHDGGRKSSGVIGFLYSGTQKSLGEQYAAFHRGLGEAGYVNGQNVAIEYRGADDHYGRLPSLAEELVHRPVTVIVAAGGPASALAAKVATASIPVVFTIVADPVKSGLVASLNRPGGNVTGSAGLTSALDSKRLELLQQLKPAAKLIGVLVNPNRPGSRAN